MATTTTATADEFKTSDAYSDCGLHATIVVVDDEVAIKAYFN